MDPQPFAAFYIAAQIDERLTEIVSRIPDELTKKVRLTGDLPAEDKGQDKVKKRALWLTVVATAIGIGIAYAAKLPLFHASGFTGLTRDLDYILTGIALGGGTKALHDVISYAQKASQKKGKPDTLPETEEA